MELPSLPADALLLAGTAALGALLLFLLWWKRAALHMQVEKKLRVRVERIVDPEELARRRGELDTQRGCGRGSACLLGAAVAEGLEGSSVRRRLAWTPAAGAHKLALPRHHPAPIAPTQTPTSPAAPPHPALVLPWSPSCAACCAC